MKTKKQMTPVYVVRRSYKGVREKAILTDLPTAEARYNRFLAELPDALVELSEICDGVMDVIRFQAGDVRFER